MKGLALSLSTVFFGFITVILILVIYYVGVGHMLGIQVAVTSAEVDRHTINLGESLMSSPYLVYNDGTSLQRGILYEPYVAKYFQGVGTSWVPVLNFLSSPNDFQKSVNYPNSFAIITVEDLQTQQVWQTYLGQIGSESVAQPIFSDLSSVVGCISNHFDVGKLYTSFTQKDFLRDYYNVWDITTCSTTEVSKNGVSERAFPISLRMPDGTIHAGLMFVNLEEF